MPRRRYRSTLSPAERSANARYAVTVRHALSTPEQRRAAGRKLREGQERKWEQQAIAMGASTPEEINKQVSLLRRAAELKFAAAGRKARAIKKGVQ